MRLPKRSFLRSQSALFVLSAGHVLQAKVPMNFVVVYVVRTPQCSVSLINVALLVVGGGADLHRLHPS